MISMLCAMAVTTVWLGLAVGLARREYDRVFAAKVNETVEYRAGKFVRENAHMDARHAAYRMLAFWLPVMCYRLIDRLLIGPQPVANPFEFMREDPVPDVDLTSDLDRLIAAEERRQNPSPDDDRRAELTRRFDGLYREFQDETDPRRRECILHAAQMVTEEIKSLGFVVGTSPECRERVIRTSRPDKIRVVPEPCPCGYTTECGMHCGDGHNNGMCPTRHTQRLSKILATPNAEIPPEPPRHPGVRYDAP